MDGWFGCKPVHLADIQSPAKSGVPSAPPRAIVPNCSELQRSLWTQMWT